MCSQSKAGELNNGGDVDCDGAYLYKLQTQFYRIPADRILVPYQLFLLEDCH